MTNETTDQLIDVELSKIVIGDNYRKTYSKESVEEMAESIKSRGILQPPIVARVLSQGNGAYDLVAGQRRVLGAKKAGLTAIKAILRQVKDYVELKELQMIENEHREELSFYDRANQFADMVKRGKKTVEEIAHDAGKSVDFINHLIRFTQLPGGIQDGVKSGKISGLHAKALLRLKDEQAMLALYKTTIKEKLSARALSERLENYECDLKDAKFDKEECQICPFRSGNQKTLYGDEVENDNLCLSPACYNNKNGASFNAMLTAHKQKGGKVISEKDRQKLGYNTHTGISEWNRPPLYKTKCTKGCPNYALYLDSKNYGNSLRKRYELNYFCLDSSCWKNQERKSDKGDGADDSYKEQRQQQMEESRKDRIKEHVRSFLAKRVTESVKGQNMVNSIMLVEFMSDYRLTQITNEILKEEKIKGRGKEDIYSLVSKWKPDKQIQCLIRFLNEQVSYYSSPVLTRIGKNFGVDIKKDFAITDEYLSIKTKEEILELAKELAIKNVLGAEKFEQSTKSSLVSLFVNSKGSKGKVPKEVLKAAGE